MNIDAYKDGKGNVIITEDSFEMLLACLDNQKFVGESPQNGDSLAEGPDSYYKTQNTIQKTIDDYNRTCREILHAGLKPFRDEKKYQLYKRYENSELNLEWQPEDVAKIQKVIPNKYFERRLMTDCYTITISDDGHKNREWSDEEFDIVKKCLNNVEDDVEN